MTNRERENKTLSFDTFQGRGSVEETFFPWNLTVGRFVGEGLPEEFAYPNIVKSTKEKRHRYINATMAEGVHDYEISLGFDHVRRFGFMDFLKCFDEEVIEDTAEYIAKRCSDGWVRRYYKGRELVNELEPAVGCTEDWSLLKEKVLKEFDKYVTDEAIADTYQPFRESHETGDFTVRFRISGYFWTPRELMGIENHMMAFYDCPDIVHDINSFITNLYIKYLDRIFDIIPPDVLLICEDLSGRNGPMISPSLFEEFVGDYYKKLIPFLKSKGVGNIFIDTDGDFTVLIPNFIEAGVDGFLPMDVNAGMDIVKVRQEFPGLKFIGGFNKLAISKGPEEIDKEFGRLMPVIRQGGYIPGADHQIAPSTSLSNYKYYIKKLHEAMLTAGKG